MSITETLLFTGLALLAPNINPKLTLPAGLAALCWAAIAAFVSHLP